MSEVTQLLEAAEAGDRHAAAELLPLVYNELRKLATARMAAESPGHTLDATALVHEAYLRLVGQVGNGQFANRGHFFTAAAEAMYRILIDHARRRATEKRGGARRRVTLEEGHRITDSPEGMIALDDVLAQFAAIDAQKADLVKLRFFAGLTMPEAAAVLGVSLATAERWWLFARTWLYAALGDEKKLPEG